MKFPEVESAVLSWLKRCMAKNVPISGPLIQREAERGAQKLGITTLKASNGWLQRFRQRNEVLFKSRSGEGADLDKDVVQRWKDETLPKKIENYEPQDILNADETDIFTVCFQPKAWFLLLKNRRAASWQKIE